MKKFILLLLVLSATPLVAANLPSNNTLPPSPEWSPVENAALT